MKRTIDRFHLSTLSLAILASLSLSANAQEEQANDEEEYAMEEVVVKASRLKGTASAVIEERKNQAFVADILGAEQISRTGDSDAAGALRRVTGLTLVDGKFIYVRGLGERYSSTTLNGAAVPSPDPTRTVIPLDLFPSSIIESLSVQKSYSPSMPAHFAGGAVDVRLKTIPSDFEFKIGGKIGTNINNFDDGITYNGGDDDWMGLDDGTREAPAQLLNLWRNYQSLNTLSQQENREIFADMNRDMDPNTTTINPDFGFDVTLGNNFDLHEDHTLGFLSAVSYNNEWEVSELYEGQDFRQNPDGTWTMVRGFDDVQQTEHQVKWSGMFNLGYQYTNDHRLDYSFVMLHDTQDQMRDKLGNTNNVLITDGLRVRDSQVRYEEREMIANQFRGSHNFPALGYLGVDWKYSLATSERYAPGNIATRYILADENMDGLWDIANESSLRKGTTASRFTYQDLQDEVTNYGYNVSLPILLDSMDIELKAGGDFIEKSRQAFARRVDVNTPAYDDLDLTGWRMNDILTDDVVLNHPLTGSETVIRDTSVAGDDYFSGQLIDAYYVEGDVLIDNTWRISGGARYEDYRQVVAPLDPATGQFDLPAQPTVEDLEALAFKEDKWFPALALTLIQSEQMQWRLSFGQSTIRPDIREVAKATYIDPLTGFPVGGTPSVRSTDVKNYDFRWEYYADTGENLSIGLFYKDLIDPIETVQSPGQDGPPLLRIANAEEGYVYGIETEFLKDFGFIGDFGQDFFLSGNLTVSDSEITIDRQAVVDQTGVSTAITNTTRRLTGHSEWVVNMNLGWDAPNGNHSATLAYNVFGDRIIVAGIEGRDDAYEQPFHSLDFVYTYYPTYSSTLKFRVQNILNEEKRLEFEDTLQLSKTEGVDVSVSFRWDF